MPTSIVQRYDENILRGITPSGSTPAESYSLATFLSLNPAARVLYESNSISLTWSTGSVTGSILVIPTSNLEGSVLTLSNGAGLSTPVPIPTMTPNRIPKTIVYDFSALVNRTSGTWTLTVTGNVANVVLGGAIAIYQPKGSLQETDFLLDSSELTTTAAVQEIKNSYLTRYRQVLRTQERTITLSRVMSQAEELKFAAWYAAGFGSGYPSLLWPYPGEEDAFFGTWPATYSRTVFDRNPVMGRIYQVSLTFTELSKGEPV